MVSSAPISPPERGFGAHVDTLARATATFLVILYGVGFIILAVHDARYGIVQFSPFRARIFMVGFVFAALVTLPAAAQYYKFAYFGPLGPVVNNTEPALEKYKDLVLAVGFVYTANLMAAFLSGFLFVPLSAPVTDPHLWQHCFLFAAAVLILLAVYTGIGKSFAKHPKGAVVFALLATGIFLAGISLYGLEHISDLTWWFLLVGLATSTVRRSSDRLRYALDFRNWFSFLLALFFYIYALFGAIPPKCGGAAPVPVVLYLNSPVAWLESNVASASLLDETDQGFYVLTSPKGKAFFVPRSNVASVYFGTKDDLPKPSK